VFGIVIVVVVQSVFRLEMHQNKKKYFLKIIFYISTSKRYENIKEIYFKQKTNLKFEGTRFAPRSQTHLYNAL
jgi:hypothetical protein